MLNENKKHTNNDSAATAQKENRVSISPVIMRKLELETGQLHYRKIWMITFVKQEHVLSQGLELELETGVSKEQSDCTYPICHLQMNHLPAANI